MRVQTFVGAPNIAHVTCLPVVRRNHSGPPLAVSITGMRDLWAAVGLGPTTQIEGIQRPTSLSERKVPARLVRVRWIARARAVG